MIALTDRLTYERMTKGQATLRYRKGLSFQPKALLSINLNNKEDFA